MQGGEERRGEERRGEACSGKGAARASGKGAARERQGSGKGAAASERSGEKDTVKYWERGGGALQCARHVSCAT